MKLSAKVKDPESAVVEMTVEMTMVEWMDLGNVIGAYSTQKDLRNKIRCMHLAMERVVEGEVLLEEENDENPKNTYRQYQ